MSASEPLLIMAAAMKARTRGFHIAGSFTSAEVDAVLDTLGPQETLRLSRIHIFHAESVATNIDRKLKSGKTCISYDEHDKPCWETTPVVRSTTSSATAVLQHSVLEQSTQRSEVCS